MGHQLSILNGQAEMAYVGPRPWHTLGNELPEGASIEQCQEGAGLTWQYNESPVHFMNGSMHTWTDNKVIYRSDNNYPLSVVSRKYKVVQPSEVLEFFRDLVEMQGFALETAGALRSGRIIWALARTGLDGEVVDNDNVKAYLLLATSCDGSMPTTATFTSVRVVCWNTMNMAINRMNKAAASVRIRHTSLFDPLMVKSLLGLDAGRIFDDYMTQMRAFANKNVSNKLAGEIVETLFVNAGKEGDVRESKGFKSVMNLFQGAGKGATMDGVAGTGWGLINAITEYADFHASARNQDNRLNSAWFGSGAKLKSEIVALVDAA